MPIADIFCFVNLSLDYQCVLLAVNIVYFKRLHENRNEI